MENQGWLLLLHQIPPKPAYFRAKVLRRLTQVGALPVKNSAYLLPDSGDALEDLEWIYREITQQGGAAWLFRAETLAGWTSPQIQDAFRELHRAEFESLIEHGRTLLRQATLTPGETLAAYHRLSRRNEELRRVDFFECPLRKELEQLMKQVGNELHRQEVTGDPSKQVQSGQVWVTRKGVRVDRIASAWLIRRFIDAESTFRFVEEDSYCHQAREIRFDMFEGEFTHHGDTCTFEVLISAHHLRGDGALVAVAEIVHDIDLKDDRYQRGETIGVARLIDGLCLQTPVDELRLERGALIFDSLYQGFR
jgi:hypothetical protein